MDTYALAEKIYMYVNKLTRSSYHWDNWDDRREIKFIEKLICEHYEKLKNNETTVLETKH